MGKRRDDVFIYTFIKCMQVASTHHRMSIISRKNHNGNDQVLDTMTIPVECRRSWRVKVDRGRNLYPKRLVETAKSVRRMYIQLLLNKTAGKARGGASVYTFEKQFALHLYSELISAGSK